MSESVQDHMQRVHLDFLTTLLGALHNGTANSYRVSRMVESSGDRTVLQFGHEFVDAVGDQVPVLTTIQITTARADAEKPFFDRCDELDTIIGEGPTS